MKKAELEVLEKYSGNLQLEDVLWQLLSPNIAPNFKELPSFIDFLKKDEIYDKQ